MEKRVSRVSASVLAILGSVFASNAKADPSSVSIANIEERSVEAAQVLKELQEAGLVYIDPDTGLVQLKRSVLEVLQATGWATRSEHSTHAADGGRTDRSKCSTPSGQ